MNDQSLPAFIIVEEPEDNNGRTLPGKTGFNFSDTKILSRVLRGIGALIIIASASTFLFQRWAPGSDLQRFLLLLGFTSVLSLGGLFCGLKLKESKGARTLLGLTLAVTPVNFAVMGALLFSQFSWDGPFASLPGYATWIAANPTAAIMTAVGGLALLAPLCHLSFMTLGHNRARLLSTTFILGNLALLLPTRQPDLIAGAFTLLTTALIYIEARFFCRDTALNTFEGWLSRGLLWVPALILIGRTSYFYAPTQLFISALCAALGLLCFIILPQMIKSKSWQQVLQATGATLGSLTWLIMADFVYPWSIDGQWLIPLFTLPIVGLLSLLSKHTISSGSNYRRTAAIIAIISATVNLYFFPGLITSFLCLLISVSVLSYGYLIEQKIIFFSGAVGTVLGLGYHLKAAINLYSLFNWGSLMILGVMIIIIASLLERNNGMLREKVLNLRSKMNQWDN